MEPEKDPNENQNPVETESPNPPNETSTSETAEVNQQAPADALSMTPDELDQQETAQPTDNADQPEQKAKPKKFSKIKKFFRRVNVYFLIFLLVLVVAGVITVVNYLNAQKDPPAPDFASQELTSEALEELANTDASIGSSSQTLTIQGNAVIGGQTLIRSNLSVAGDVQASGSMQGSSLTVSGESNLANTQINSLQVASNAAIEGDTTLRNLSVSGTASFNGAVTAPQLTVSRLTMSGNAVLEIPNHIRFSGPSPSRNIISRTLGAGGSASVNGSDTNGTANINTGSNPSAGCFMQINFHRQFSNNPHVIISPVGSGAGSLDYYVDRNQSSFSICTNSAAPANRSFAFDYFVTS